MITAKKKKKTLRVHHAFLYMSQPRSQGSLLPALHRAGRKEPWERGCIFLCRFTTMHNVRLPNFTLCGGCEPKATIFLSFKLN